MILKCEKTLIIYIYPLVANLLWRSPWEEPLNNKMHPRFNTERNFMWFFQPHSHRFTCTDYCLCSRRPGKLAKNKSCSFDKINNHRECLKYGHQYIVLYFENEGTILFRALFDWRCPDFTYSVMDWCFKICSRELIIILANRKIVVWNCVFQYFNTNL